MINGEIKKFYLVCCVDCSYLYSANVKNMNKKETFLNSILDQIKVLQQAYDANKNLPDYIFENIQSLKLPENVEKNVVVIDAKKQDGAALEYGENKKTVIRILEEKQRAMLKAEIVDEYMNDWVVPENMAINAVTNSLAALSQDGIIKGHKPAGLKFKGKFWTLSEWWQDGKLPLQYEPYAGKLKQL
jgi:hypothetical protein